MILVIGALCFVLGVIAGFFGSIALLVLSG